MAASLIPSDLSQEVVAVFGSSQSQPGDDDYALGVEVGRLLAAAGFAVTNGGYDGLMKAVSQGAVSAGGRTIGVTAPNLFPDRTGGNEHLTDEIPAGSLTHRIHLMSEMAVAAIVLPGSIGTLTGLLVVWNEAFISTMRGATPRPIIAVGGPWKALAGTIGEVLHADTGLVTFVDTADEAVRQMQQLLQATRSSSSQYVIDR